MDEQFSSNNKPGPGIGVGPLVDPQQLAQLVMAARAAQQGSLEAAARKPSPAPPAFNGPGPGVGPVLDPRQLALLVMAARASQQRGEPAALQPASQPGGQLAGPALQPGPGAGIGDSVDPQQLVRCAMTASVLRPTDPFAAGAGNKGPNPNPDKAVEIQRLPYLNSHKPPAIQKLPYLNAPVKAMVLQNLRQPAQANSQQQAPLQPASPVMRHSFGGQNSQYADSLKWAADYLKWRNQNLRPATGGGWEAPSGRLYTEEEVRGLYAAQKQEADRAQQRREQERHASAVSKGITTTITYGDGTKETRKGNHPQRDNNPGNMEAGGFTSAHGAIGKDKGFAIFASPEAGWAAMDARLRTSEWQNKTVDQTISDWAPPKDAKGRVINDTADYQKKVRSALGVKGDTKLSSLTPEQFDNLRQTMARIEGFYEDRPNKKVKVNRAQPK